MHRNRSSSKKRSRSPAVLPQSPTRQRDPLPSMDKVQLNGTSSEGQDLPSKTISDLKPSVKMPAFLRLSDSDQLEKFNELQELEKGRLESRKHDKSLEAEWALPNPDRILDRYTNISPWYKNRVKLQVPEGYSDYINASPIDLASLSRATDSTTAAQDKYICMQGPKEETIDHTWMMVWQSLSNPSKTSPAVIIMLTPTHVPVFPGAPARFGLQEKCYPYYPLDERSEPLKINEPYQTISNENDEDSYHPLGENFKATVRFVSREETPQGEEIELRKLAMRVEGHDEEKIIYHFLYPGWPDFGAPEQEHLDSILSLMHLSRQKNSAPGNPRIVHCSAGVGRSGTFVALEYLVGELDAGAWENIDDSKDPIFEAVNSLRTQRRTMVQSPEQYLFLYQAMKKLWERKYGASEDTETTEPAAKIARTHVDGSVFE